MRDNIINVLKNADKALDIFELQDLLEINTVEETSLLGEELRKMEDEVIIYHSHKDKYMLLEKSHLRKGVMRANKKGFGFVEIENHFEITDIINIAVLDRFQHNGIGLKLLDYVIKNTDATKIMLEVNENNKKALNFYKKNKFIEINRRKNYYDGADAIIMERSK